MSKFFKSLEKIAPVALRYGMGIVILWFSSQQFLHTDSWTAYVPDSVVAMTGFSATVFVYVNAVFELVFGLMMVFGIQTRLSALLLGLHLLDIMWVVGYGEIGVRDFGLAIATLVVFMNGPDTLCLDFKEKIIDKTLKNITQQTQTAPKIIVNS